MHHIGVLLLLLTARIHAYVPRDSLPACVNQNANYICGKTGRLGSDHPENHLIGYDNVTSVDACRIMCIQEGGPETGIPCGTLTWSNVTKKCEIYEYLPAKNQFQADPKLNTVVYAYPCFDCIERACPDTSTVNPFVNPEFDSPIAKINPPQNVNYSPWEARYLGAGTNCTLTPGYNSPNALTCTNGQAFFSQRMRLCDDQRYQLTFDYILRTISSQNAYLSVHVGEADTYKVPLPRDDAGKWVPFFEAFGGAFNTPPGAVNNKTLGWGFMSFSIRADVYTQVSIDNIRIQPLVPVKPAANAVNLIINGGLETGQLSPWHARGDEYSKLLAVVRPGLNSTYALGLPSYNDFSNLGAVCQNVTLARHKKHILSFSYLKRGSHCSQTEPSYDRSSIKLRFQHQPGTDFAVRDNTYDDLDTPFTPAGQWVQYERPFMANGNITNFCLEIMSEQENYDPSTVCRISIDNVSIKAAA